MPSRPSSRPALGAVDGVVEVRLWTRGSEWMVLERVWWVRAAVGGEPNEAGSRCCACSHVRLMLDSDLEVGGGFVLNLCLTGCSPPPPPPAFAVVVLVSEGAASDSVEDCFLRSRFSSWFDLSAHELFECVLLTVVDAGSSYSCWLVVVCSFDLILNSFEVVFLR